MLSIEVESRAFDSRVLLIRTLLLVLMIGVVPRCRLLPLTGSGMQIVGRLIVVSLVYATVLVWYMVTLVVVHVLLTLLTQVILRQLGRLATFLIRLAPPGLQIRRTRILVVASVRVVVMAVVPRDWVFRDLLNINR